MFLGSLIDYVLRGCVKVVTVLFTRREEFEAPIRFVVRHPTCPRKKRRPDTEEDPDKKKKKKKQDAKKSTWRKEKKKLLFRGLLHLLFLYGYR
jgi:hypothetical protein